MSAKGSFTGGASGVLYTDRRNFYINPNEVAELIGSVAPFTSFLNSLGIETTNDPDFKMFEYRPKWYSMNGYVKTAITWYGQAFTPVQQNIDLTKDQAGQNEIDYLVPGDLVEVIASDSGTRKNGKNADVTVAVGDVVARFRVMTKNGKSCTIHALDAKGDGTYTINCKNTDTLRIYSHASEEGSGAPDSWADELEVAWGSTQIIKTPLRITRTLAHMTTLRGDNNELARQRRSKFAEHQMKLNYALLLGVRINGFGAPTSHIMGQEHQVRTTMGIVPTVRYFGTADKNYFVRQWADYTLDDFIDDMKEACRYDEGRKNKLALCGPKVIANISKTGEDSFFARSGGSVTINDWQITSMGFYVRQIQHPFGVLSLAYDSALKDAPYDNCMIIVDPEYVRRVNFRPDAYQTGLQAPDEDIILDQYFSDSGLKVELPEKHALFMFS